MLFIDLLKKTACLIHRRQMAAICGIKPWIGIHRNDTAAYLNDMILATVSGCLAIFSFLSNLVIIVTVIKTPSLQKPCNILLSNLAFADCLTGVIVQPMFIVWRLFLRRAQQSCLHQVSVLHFTSAHGWFIICQRYNYQFWSPLCPGQTSGVYNSRH